MSGPRLVLLCGLPGSGKSTLARQLVRERPAVTFSPAQWIADLVVSVSDEPFRYRLEQRFIRLGWELLALGVTVVLEFGLWGRSERDELREGARARGVPVELHHLDVPLDELWRRVEARNAWAEHGAVVLSRADLERFAAVFQPPDAAELALFTAPVPSPGTPRR